MTDVALKEATFSDTGEGIATVKFDTRNTGGSAQIIVQVPTRVVEMGKAFGDTTSRRIVDDADVVKEARRKLHDFATLLAGQTKEWAAP